MSAFNSLKFYTRQVLDRDTLAHQLVSLGYIRREAVSDEGDFAVRGGIVDIFPATFELPVRISLESDTVESIRSFDAVKGNPVWDHSMLIVLPFRKSPAARLKSFNEKFPLGNFIDISIGDYIVHTRYGVGRFLGMQAMRSPKGKTEDTLVVEYDRQEKLFVPVSQMHLVQKYISFHVKRPKLNRLGSKEWLRIKNRARKGAQKYAWELLSLQAMRMSAEGYAFGPDTEWQLQFEKTFPFRETPDQVTALAQVKKDMEMRRPMDRLLCGDVGYGKTEVAMRAAFKAVMDGRQVAYLVPTTILAEQHYENFTSRLKDFALNVAMLSRFRTPAEQKKIVEETAAGGVDVLIGTHRLLSDDVCFKNLGLLIIDEEQRFGVKAKEKLKALRLAADVLTLTATPIPRTLYMSMMGAKDFSLINTPPENRLPIKTVVVEYDEDLLRQAMAKELSRSGQIFFLHNRIEDIEKVRDRIRKLLPAPVTLAIGHGQMPSRELEQVMAGFLKGKTQVLLSTMIIESGIDIPNANTIIVNNAHTFGLSDLHQLRGRVGRFDRRAYAYFIVPPEASLSTAASRRLSALQEYSHLGAGFTIAMEDLEIRVAGNLLGVEQHGFVNAVGFDLYCRLLREAIATLKKAEKGKV